jgi:hypothetical protein
LQLIEETGIIIFPSRISNPVMESLLFHKIIPCIQPEHVAQKSPLMYNTLNSTTGSQEQAALAERCLIQS